MNLLEASKYIQKLVQKILLIYNEKSVNLEIDLKIDEL